MKKNQLLQVTTSDGLYLHGYYVPSEDKKVAVLHIHGLEGNFYENSFVHVLANELEDKGVGFLVVNTRGNGKDTDFNTISGQYRRIGARYELLEEAHLDITAWLEFLVKENYQEIVLMGHSLGTYKVVRYLFEGELKTKVDKLILLAPFDQKALLEAYVKTPVGELLDKAQVKVGEGKGEELITGDFDSITLSYQTYLSWYRPTSFSRMFEFCSPNYDFPILNQIKIPTKIVVGSKDEYFHQANPEHPEEAMNLLLKNISDSQGKIIEGAIHSYKPHEEEMAKEIVEFALTRSPKQN